MVIKVSKKASAKQIQLELKKLPKKAARKGFDATKYFGKLVRGLDGVEYQKKSRDEWH